MRHFLVLAPRESCDRCIRLRQVDLRLVENPCGFDDYGIGLGMGPTHQCCTTTATVQSLAVVSGTFELYSVEFRAREDSSLYSNAIKEMNLWSTNAILPNDMGLDSTLHPVHVTKHTDFTQRTECVMILDLLVINRPGVAGAVLQSPLSMID